MHTHDRLLTRQVAATKPQRGRLADFGELSGVELVAGRRGYTNSVESTAIAAQRRFPEESDFFCDYSCPRDASASCGAGCGKADNGSRGMDVTWPFAGFFLATGLAFLLPTFLAVFETGFFLPAFITGFFTAFFFAFFVAVFLAVGRSAFLDVFFAALVVVFFATFFAAARLGAFVFATFFLAMRWILQKSGTIVIELEQALPYPHRGRLV